MENGLAILTAKEQLDMYISSYGEIHQQKLQMAYEQIPHKVWAEGSFSVVDYGCGQCIAEMVLSDFLRYHYIDNDKISDFTVIEPSKASLAQGLQYLETFFENSKITAHNVSARHLTEDYIRPQSDTVIHIFSNVLDIIEFERHNIARILNSDMSHNHILVCVSPFYQETGKQIAISTSEEPSVMPMQFSESISDEVCLDEDEIEFAEEIVSCNDNSFEVLEIIEGMRHIRFYDGTDAYVGMDLSDDDILHQKAYDDSRDFESELEEAYNM